MKYLINLTERCYGHVEVDAENEGEALAKGVSSVNEGNVNWTKTEITEIYAYAERNYKNEI